MNLTIIGILLVGLVVSAAICVMLQNLVKSAIAMAVTSAVLSILMFVLEAPLVAVFELSICAGLIPVIFVSAINMTPEQSREVVAQKEERRIRRFTLLPVLLIVLAAALLALLWPHISTLLPTVLARGGVSAQHILWDQRQVDLLGQIIIILTGVYGVIVFFKESDSK